jgi:hypothetical protein
LVSDRAPKVESLFETADCRAEITKLDVNFCLFNINFGNGLVVEKYFVEFYQSLFKVVVFQ